ncbi:hypothetical protein H5410_001628 [Solanum commersonii]|uniref:Uncharacterized protein n=1 Tax=Solanum commersonii TaxID=4109 RepID=A0A9J6B0M5_SOLCO|nr:hypothetical protein H5410_001628 [Solanum commersonii]
MVVGVLKGFEKKLQIVGVGYCATIDMKDIVLNLWILSSIVGQFVASIRKWRPPEPYKGKGVKYVDEVVRRKEVCGVGETDESITHLTEVVASPALPSGEIFPCSPTLVLSCDKSHNLEEQSVVKSSVDPPIEEVEVASRAVSFTMSERLFEGESPEGRGLESSILVAGVELVVVQSLSSLKGDVQLTLLEPELKSQEQVPHSVQLVFDQTPRSFDVESEEEKEEEPLLRWSRRGVRGANPLAVGVLDLETVKSAPKDNITDENVEFAKERRKKVKGKMVKYHSKRDKKSYGSRSKTQNVLGSAIAANLILTERARKRRREEKRRKEAKDERVKSKEIQKEAKKLPVKKKRVRKRVTVKTSPVKGQSPSVQNQVADREMTREERIDEMEKQKVLNGRVFDPNILTQFGMSNLFDVVSLQGLGHLFDPPTPYLHELEVYEFYYKMELLEDGGIMTCVKNVKIFLDEETLGIILGVPLKVIWSIEDCKPLSEFRKQATKCGDIMQARLPKKFLRGEHKLLFEFINKVLVPRIEK